MNIKINKKNFEENNILTNNISCLLLFLYKFVNYMKHLSIILYFLKILLSVKRKKIMNIKKFNPHLKVILAALLWSTSGIFIRVLKLPPGIFSFYRMAVPSLFLFIYLKIQKEKIIKGSILLLLLGSFLNAIRLFLYYVSFDFTSLGNAVVILYTWPVFMTILSSIFLKEKINLQNGILLIVAFLGIIVVFIKKEFSFQDKDFFGMLAMLISSVIYSFSLLIFKKKTDQYSGFEITFYQNIVGAVICIPFIFLQTDISIIEISLAGLQGFIVGLLGFFFFFSALKELTSAKASLLSYLEVLSTIFIGLLLFHEPITWNLIAGGSMILISVIFLKR